MFYGFRENKSQALTCCRNEFICAFNTSLFFLFLANAETIKMKMVKWIVGLGHYSNIYSLRMLHSLRAGRYKYISLSTKFLDMNNLCSDFSPYLTRLRQSIYRSAKHENNDYRRKRPQTNSQFHSIFELRFLHAVCSSSIIATSLCSRFIFFLLHFKCTNVN